MGHDFAHRLVIRNHTRWGWVNAITDRLAVDLDLITKLDALTNVSGLVIDRNPPFQNQLFHLKARTQTRLGQYLVQLRGFDLRQQHPLRRYCICRRVLFVETTGHHVFELVALHYGRGLAFVAPRTFRARGPLAALSPRTTLPLLRTAVTHDRCRIRSGRLRSDCRRLNRCCFRRGGFDHRVWCTQLRSSHCLRRRHLSRGSHRLFAGSPLGGRLLGNGLRVCGIQPGQICRLFGSRVVHQVFPWIPPGASTSSSWRSVSTS